jgi:hypothetical protein
VTTFAEEIRVCPVCESRFRVAAVQSSGSAGADSDFRPHHWGPDPLPGYVHACMDCGFSGYAHDFDDGVSETVMRKIRKFLSPRTRDLARVNAAYFRYEFLALIYEWDDRSSLEVAEGFLRASWVARACDNREKERLYQREAVRRFEEALEIGECERQDERAVVSYLIGELHRRLNRKRRAETWFHRSLEEHAMLRADDGDAFGWLEAQIRQQLSAPSDRMN